MNKNDFLAQLNEKKRNEYDLLFLINYICQRPLMFVGDNNIRTVGAFIDGFAFANDTFSAELKDFNEWLAIRFGSSNNKPWWYILEKQYSNNEDILRDLPSLFDEFEKSKASVGS